MTKTIELKDGDFAIVIRMRDGGVPQAIVTGHTSEQFGTLRSVVITSRNPFGDTKAKTKERWERPKYYSTNTTAMRGAIADVAKEISIAFSGWCGRRYMERIEDGNG